MLKVPEFKVGDKVRIMQTDRVPTELQNCYGVVTDVGKKHWWHADQRVVVCTTHQGTHNFLSSQLMKVGFGEYKQHLKGRKQ